MARRQPVFIVRSVHGRCTDASVEASVRSNLLINKDMNATDAKDAESLPLRPPLHAIPLGIEHMFFGTPLLKGYSVRSVRSVHLQ